MQVKFNTFVKADTQIEAVGRRTISYLKGYSYPRLYCKKLKNQRPSAKSVSTTRRTILRWMRGEIKELLFISYLVFALFFNKYLKKQNVACSEMSYQFLVPKVPVWRKK